MIQVNHRSGENPLEFLTRNGFRVLCYRGLRIARRYNKRGRCVMDVSAGSMRSLAILVGWYP
jgi:predicted nuclease with RNAse H fold